MTSNYLLGEYNDEISILISRYGKDSPIKDEEVMKYIMAILHKHLNMINANLVANNPGSIHAKYRLTIDKDDLNGMFKIHKVIESLMGYYISSETLIARFWMVTRENNNVEPNVFAGLESRVAAEHS